MLPDSTATLATYEIGVKNRAIVSHPDKKSGKVAINRSLKTRAIKGVDSDKTACFRPVRSDNYVQDTIFLASMVVFMDKSMANTKYVYMTFFLSIRSLNSKLATFNY